MKHRKDTLRSQALAQRDAMSATERQAISEALSAYAGMLCSEGETVSAFWPIRTEIDPRPLMSALAARGNCLALPVIIEKGVMVFRLFEDSSRLVDMEFGIQGPAATAAIVDPATMLLPLAAFDSRGNRIGYGGGYYDRAIAEMRGRGLKPHLVGLAFDCQQVAGIPASPHDIPMQAILTESGFRALC